LPVFGLGCAAGVLGLGRGVDIAQARPGACVVVATVELCSLILRLDDTGKTSLVANALFGDGAAAAVLTADPAAPGPTIAAHGEHLFPDSLDVMGWRVDDAGLGVILARSVPEIVRRDLAPVAEAFLARHGRRRSDLADLAAHPGGAKVLTALGEAFDDPAGLAVSRAVLAEAGNMSAPTVLFVLERLLAGGVDGPILATALGPGFTAGFALIDPAGGGA
jgi:alkylresorcinol/alkylpyrone synthase